MEIIEFLYKTPLGLAVVIGSLFLFFVIVAMLYERKTRKLYPDLERRGTKAVAKEKAKKKRAAQVTKAAKKATQEADEEVAESAAEELTEETAEDVAVDVVEDVAKA